MDRQELRLRCIEAACSKATDPNDQMARAEKFLKWILEPADDKAQVGPEVKRLDPNKRTDNSKILP